MTHVWLSVPGWPKRKCLPSLRFTSHKLPRSASPEQHHSKWHYHTITLTEFCSVDRIGKPRETLQEREKGVGTKRALLSGKIKGIYCSRSQMGKANLICGKTITLILELRDFPYPDIYELTTRSLSMILMTHYLPLILKLPVGKTNRTPPPGSAMQLIRTTLYNKSSQKYPYRSATPIISSLSLFVIMADEWYTEY